MNNQFIKQLINNKFTTQSIVLLLSTVLSMIFTIGVNYLLTRILDPVQYGNYSYIINIFILAQTLFSFGYFYTICRLISLIDDRKIIREYYCVGLIIWLLLSIVMCVLLGIYSLTIDDFRDKQILNIFLAILPLGSVYLFTQFNESVLQGDNRINLLSVSRLLPRIIFFLCLLFIYLSKKNINLLFVLIVYFCTYIIVYVYIVRKIRPSFSNLRKNFEKIKDINKVYGFPIYIGSLFAVGTGSFVGIALGLLSEDNITVGFYNIAQQISIPLSMIPNIISTVLYKRYVSTSRINSKILLILLSLCIAIFICILLFAKPFISLVFGEEYLTAIPLLKYMCFGALSYGIADFFNKYLLSKGFGVQLRNVSIIVGIIMLLIAYPLIYYWGCYGAAYIKAVTGIVYIISIVFTYKKSIKFSNAD